MRGGLSEGGGEGLREREGVAGRKRRGRGDVGGEDGG